MHLGADADSGDGGWGLGGHDSEGGLRAEVEISLANSLLKTFCRFDSCWPAVADPVLCGLQQKHKIDASSHWLVLTEELFLIP